MAPVLKWEDELLFSLISGGAGKQAGPQAWIDRNGRLVEAGVGVVGVVPVRCQLRRLCG